MSILKAEVASAEGGGEEKANTRILGSPGSGGCSEAEAISVFTVAYQGGRHYSKAANKVSRVSKDQSFVEFYTSYHYMWTCYVTDSWGIQKGRIELEQNLCAY